MRQIFRSVYFWLRSNRHVYASAPLASCVLYASAHEIVDNIVPKSLFFRFRQPQRLPLPLSAEVIFRIYLRVRSVDLLQLVARRPVTQAKTSRGLNVHFLC